MSNDTHPSGMALSVEEIHILVLIERTGAGLSMVGIVAVVSAYLLFKRLRTTPNLFLFLAILSNAGACIASMIGYDGLEQGETSTLCQAQSFIFQWFMQADPWWSFAMAINVFLVFFYNADPESFRKYVWVYCLVCFGGPLITAIALVSIQDPSRGPVYGDAAVSTQLDLGKGTRWLTTCRCGAGSAPTGVLFDYTRTISQCGPASSCPLSSTLPSATMSSTIATYFEALPNHDPKKMRKRSSLYMIAAAHLGSRRNRFVPPNCPSMGG